MDAVIEGWHGYKPTDKHKIDIDANNIKLSAEQAAKFDQYVISTRIRAGRSIRGLPLPPGTNRAQRRKVSEDCKMRTRPSLCTGIYQKASDNT